MPVNKEPKANEKHRVGGREVGCIHHDRALKVSIKPEVAPKTLTSP
jgi:hypothetical protein